MLGGMQTRPIGDHLREWRQRRRLSQLDLALDAEISTKHLSFLENRAAPSHPAKMVLRLAEELDVPLRERNVLLISAAMRRCFHSDRSATRRCKPRARRSDLVLKVMSPIRRSRSTGIGISSRTMPPIPRPLLAAASPKAAAAAGQRAASLAASGRARRAIENLGEWRAHLIARLRQQIGTPRRMRNSRAARRARRLSGAGRREAAGENQRHFTTIAGVVVPLRFATGAGTLFAVSPPRRSSARRSTSRSPSWRSSRSSGRCHDCRCCCAR